MGFADQAFLQLPNKQLFTFLVLADAVSRKVYAQVLTVNNPNNLKKVLTNMFKTQNCPYFPLIKLDKDKNWAVLQKFFAERQMWMQQKHSLHHLHFLEPLIHVLKKKVIQSHRKQRQRKGYAPAFLKIKLQDAVHSFNSTISNAHKLTPNQANDPCLDPYLRALDTVFLLPGRET